MREQLEAGHRRKTHRIENFSETLAGMAVFVLASPSMPCSERDGSRIRPISTVTLSDDSVIEPPTDSSTSAIE
jgi:hypothetical protein